MTLETRVWLTDALLAIMIVWHVCSKTMQCAAGEPVVFDNGPACHEDGDDPGAY